MPIVKFGHLPCPWPCTSGELARCRKSYFLQFFRVRSCIYVHTIHLLAHLTINRLFCLPKGPSQPVFTFCHHESHHMVAFPIKLLLFHHNFLLNIGTPIYVTELYRISCMIGDYFAMLHLGHVPPSYFHPCPEVHKNGSKFCCLWNFALAIEFYYILLYL